MTAPKTKYPVSSFGPELMAFLIRAGRERIMLTFASQQVPEEEGSEKLEWDGSGKKKAHAFQRRIHTLRRRMQDEKHPDYRFAARARVSIFWGPNAVLEGAPKEWINDHKGDRGAIIVGRPHDTEFGDALKAAGVDVSTPGAPPIEPSPEPVSGPHSTPAPLSDMLDEIWPDQKETK